MLQSVVETNKGETIRKKLPSTNDTSFNQSGEEQLWKFVYTLDIIGTIGMAHVLRSSAMGMIYGGWKLQPLYYS